MQQAPIPPHQIAPLIPPELSVAVMRALEKDPARRFSTAEEFLNAIQLSPSQLNVVAAYSATAAMPAAPPVSMPPAPSSQPPVSQPLISQPLISRPLTAAMEQKPASGSGFESLPLEEVSRKLAVYIGPVAKFVVKKLAAQSSDLDTIYREAAKQITSETDRAAFLRSKKQ
jgi:serine/threonine-protein kinase